MLKVMHYYVESESIEHCVVRTSPFGIISFWKQLPGLQTENHAQAKCRSICQTAEIYNSIINQISNPSYTFGLVIIKFGHTYLLAKDG